VFFIQEPLLTTLLPELKICSYELLLSGINHNLVCEATSTVLHCYAQWIDHAKFSCEIFLIIGSYNFV